LPTAAEFCFLQVYSITGDSSPFDLTGVLFEVIIFDHFLNDLITEHFIPFILKAAQKGGGEIFSCPILSRFSLVQLHVSFVGRL